ncbi:nitroreductase family protein [Paenibacillus sp. TRM 82003]|uniref:nitroreductase family protein n=1 Tax=Kineococcus sp. TRM81007 TaxID=2925831 RepID=UPI001F55B14D|nr:nitroreductase family protein [Kineococcus sp. TRM81007]MCI2240387.1 nitroreductase family protein [Kineococcus sp. TRM81007]MCI3927437.1 nitroreductase family protein [Paenibacillus sp. TRM 82003]
MDFGEVLRRRRMVRRYDGRPVADEVLRRVLAAALRAPSAGNSQGRDLLVLRAPEDRGAFWELTTRGRPGPAGAWLAGMRTAPVLVLLLADPGAYAERYALPDKPGPDRDAASWEVPWPEVDTGMSALLVLLAAVDEGLGACLFGVPSAARDALRERFAVPAGRRFVAAVAVGHPAPGEASRPSRPHRRTLADSAHDGAFGAPWPA